MPRLTASQLGRAVRCPGSMTLPHHDTTSEAAERGSAVHDFLEQAPALGREAALEQVPAEYRHLCDVLSLERMDARLVPEVAFAFDVETGRARELGRGLGRDYSSATASEIVGTADVFGLSPAAVLVRDWKTGWSSVDPAMSNMQVRFLAMAAARAHGRDRAVVEVVRIRESGDTWTDQAELDVFDLDETAAQVRALYQRINAPNVPFSQGPWCQFCPAFAACPTKGALLRRLADGSEAHELELMLPLTPEMAATAYHRWRAAKALLKRVEAEICELARRTPIPLGDGRVFGELLTEGNEQLDGDIVWDVLRERYGREVADKAVTRAATKARLTSVIRGRLNEKRTLSKTVNSVLGEVRKRGGASRPTRKELTEYSASERDEKESA
jgi:hypothetical protein